MSTPPTPKPRTRRVSLTKGEMQRIFTCLGANVGMLEADCIVADMPVSLMNEHVKPMRALQARFYDAIAEFSEGE